MIDQLIIDGIGSHDEYDASVSMRKDIAPKKKKIKQTVPFSNATYDFSKIDGEIYWEERSLEYVFEIVGKTAEEVEAKKLAFSSWIMNVMKSELHDPYLKDYHYIGTFDDITYDDSEVEKSTITVSFTAYPYKISNEPKVYNGELKPAAGELSIDVVSAHRIVPTFESDVGFILNLRGQGYSFPAGTTKSDKVTLHPGNNVLTIESEHEGIVEVKFHEEVF